MKRVFIIAALFCAAVSCAPKDANQRLAEMAAEEYLTPVHPGSSERPFWNGFAKKFIYAPAFDFQAVEGATEYLYKVTSEVGEWSLRQRVRSAHSLRFGTKFHRAQTSHLPSKA